MKRYEFRKGTSNKFWEVERSGKKLTVRWGRIGGTPSAKTTAFESEDAAQTEHDKLVAEKTKKGYTLAKASKTAKTAKTANVKPTASIRAKGRSHDISADPAEQVDLRDVEKHIGMPVGPMMKELIALCEATQPSSPAEAFGLLGAHGQLIFEIFVVPWSKIGWTKKKRLRAFATDHKNVVSFVIGDGATTDDCPIAYEDVVGAEEPTIIAADLATFLSQLAFSPPEGYSPEDRKDIKRLATNLKTHPAVSKSRARAEVPDDLAAIDLDEPAGKKPAGAEKPRASGGKLSSADIEKAKKLLEKAQATTYDKSAKAALPIAQQAMTLLQRLPYSAPSGYVRESAEEQVLELLVESKQRPAAKRLWEEVIARWASEGAGGVSWLSMADMQRKLKAKLPAPVRDSVRRAWADGRFSNTYSFARGPTYDKPPAKPSKEYADSDAAKAIAHKKFDLARRCIAAFRKDPENAFKCDLLEVAMLEVEGKHAEAVAAYQKLLTASLATRSWIDWESLAALQILLDVEDPAKKKKIVSAWNRQDDNASSAIYES